ncbi:fluoride efflux transporter CrcB [Sporosarcina luteola]|uniref:fluoride efflux transporter CrcB n=1 Tax=Sporosarcina luteola TaxID=582850 RepID=UPI00203C5619|nr:fluoride efflux transporter CrcB [Sporosarcina luteola]MCM3742555.1 fluoride efflux transporter CrcB [Sporosarcina luteola]
MKQALFVGIAGAIGAICRIGIGRLLEGSSEFPIGTLTANLLGTFILCLLSAGVIHRLTADQQLQTAITTGFLGSFTTFSTFSMETVSLIQNGQMMHAALYFAVSVIGGLTVGLYGIRIGSRMVSV